MAYQSSTDQDRSDRRPIENSSRRTSSLRAERDQAVRVRRRGHCDGYLVLGHDADYSRLALKVPGEELKHHLLVSELTLAELVAAPQVGPRPSSSRCSTPRS